MIEKLLEFVRKAGDAQLKLRQEKNLEINFKDSNLVSMVTKTDLQISKMFRDFVEQEFSDLNYFVIDEECLSYYGKSVFEEIENSDYLFVIDPLDGTLHYSQNIPLYGISIGVFKRGVPYVGVMYLPGIREIVYAGEDTKAYWLRNAFMPNEHKILLHPEYETKSPLIVDLQKHFSLDESKNEAGYLFVDYMCSVFSYVLIATGRVRSGMFKDWLWDMAGAWAVFFALGYKIYDVKSNKYIEKLDGNDFTSDLKFKNAHVIGPQKEIQYLVKMIVKDLEK